MKTSILILFAAMLSMVSCAQNIPKVNVPAVVVNSFQQKYPKANDVEWKRKGPLYEVEFETGLAGNDHTMLLDSLGKISYHKADIAQSDLPDMVKKTISGQYPGYAIHDVEKIENSGAITYIVTYKVELKKRSEEWEIVFDADGRILSKVAD